MVRSNVPQCWRVKALTQIHAGVQKAVADHPALEHSQNHAPEIRAGRPAQRHWITPAQDPGTTPDHLPPTAKHQWRVIQAVDEHRTSKSENLKCKLFPYLHYRHQAGVVPTFN